MTKGSILMGISDYRGYQGHEIVINNLCKGLDQLGYHTSIGAFSFSQSPPAGIEQVKLKIIGSLPHNSSGSNYDIFHIHQGRLIYYSLLTTTPTVFHFHGSNSRMQDINLKMSILLCKNRIKRVISISQAASNQLRNLVGKFSTDVIYNGVDTKFFHPHLSKPYTKGDPQLLFVGHLYPHKNVDKIIQAMPKVLELYPNAHLQIVGDGEDLLRLAQLITKRKLERNVELVGKVSTEDLRLRHSSCDVYVSASKWEMFGLPVLEAMACGKPVIVSDIESHRELIEMSNGGLSFSLLDDSDFYRKLGQVYEKKKLFGLAARKFAETYDWNEVCMRVASVYENIMH